MRLHLHVWRDDDPWIEYPYKDAPTAPQFRFRCRCGERRGSVSPWVRKWSFQREVVSSAPTAYRRVWLPPENEVQAAVELLKCGEPMVQMPYSDGFWELVARTVLEAAHDARGEKPPSIHGQD